jgi:hypothetical protein
MRTFLATIVVCCGLQSASASLAPPSAPCPDPEREFLELTLARLVRHGFIDQRNLIAYREARPRDALAAACKAAPAERPHGHAANAFGGV